MNIGERIYNFRTEKGMSQGDLAEKLDVSRQSISKWENNSAVPDLDKIIKLSEIFDITIDELVKGVTQDKTDETTYSTLKTEQKVEYIYVQPQNASMEGRKIAGIILFCMAALFTFGILFATGSLGGILYAIPFIICGIICFTVKKNTGLWCAWTVYAMVDIFMRWGTSINPNLIFMTFQFTPQMNYTRLAAAWVWVILLILLVVFTVIRLRATPVKDTKKLKTKLSVGWAVYILLCTGRTLWARTEMYRNIMFSIVQSNGEAYFIISNIINLADIAFITLLIVHTSRYIYNRKAI